MPWDALPGVVGERLRRESIFTADQWLALGRRRFQIFGITRAMVSQIDAAVQRQTP
jgi:hypothetical protein